MLTLTRKPGESVFVEIGDGEVVEFLVKEVRGGAIRIGIQAPTGRRILRGELYRRLVAAPAIEGEKT